MYHIKRFTVIRSIAYAIPDTPPNPLQKTSENAKPWGLAFSLIKPMKINISGSGCPANMVHTLTPPRSGSPAPGTCCYQGGEHMQYRKHAAVPFV